jgi:hypothetical protein
MTEKVNDSAHTIIIHGKRYTKERAWAPSKNISYRTSKRHRDNGMPWLEWGGEVYIPDTDGDAYILQFVRRRNPPRAAHRRRQEAHRSTPA